MARYLAVLLLMLGLSPAVLAQVFVGPQTYGVGTYDIDLPLAGKGLSSVSVQTTGGGTYTATLKISTDRETFVTIPSTEADTTAITSDGIYNAGVPAKGTFRVHLVVASGQEAISIVGGPGDYAPASGTALPTNAAQETGGNLAAILAKQSSDPSTGGKQDTGNTSLASILAKQPSDPSTGAKQDTGNTSAATTAANTGTTATNTGTTATGVGAPADAAYAGSGSSSIIAALKGLFHIGTPTQTSVSCGNTSTTLLAAAAASKFISVKVPSTAANIVWFNWTGAAAVTAAPSEDIGIGQKVTWTAGQDGFLPTAQINCIASSATTVTVEYQ
jgi:hypothetical protein